MIRIKDIHQACAAVGRQWCERQMLCEADADPRVVAPHRAQIRADTRLDCSSDDRPQEIKRIVVARYSFTPSAFRITEGMI
jgi:hypothetical protein